MTPAWQLASLGSLDAAEQCARRAESAVPAYRRFLADRGFVAGDGFLARPLMDKQHYLAACEFRDLLADNADDTFTIFASSGSSGRSFYWPQLRENHRGAVARLKEFLEQMFHIDRRRTLAVVGLALGSWIGGEHFSWALKSVALDCSYPFAVFSPGNRHDEILRIVQGAERYFDQVLLFVCPSAIAHLHLLAEMKGQTLPLANMRYVVLGEPFPESVRTLLQSQAGIADPTRLMLSVYGSADTGLLGVESPSSVAVRQLLSENPAWCQELGLEPPLPHFFHCTAAEAYLEAVGGELCITRWQGIPLVRYNLHDDVRLLPWPTLKETITQLCRRTPVTKPLTRVVADAPQNLPDVLAIRGRADRAVILCGTNLTEAMLDEAVRCPELQPLLTGAYRAGLRYDGPRQRLAFDLELRSDVAADAPTVEAIYHALVQAIGRVQPEFLDDWRNVYQVWDANAEQRILHLDCIPWPGISAGTQHQIKQKGLVS